VDPGQWSRTQRGGRCSSRWSTFDLTDLADLTDLHRTDIRGLIMIPAPPTMSP
jgi:hypothetical protein